MNEKSEPAPEVTKAWEESRKKAYASGRDIDKEFIDRGFVEVQAKIDFMNSMYGQTSYDVFLEGQSSPEAFERFRTENSKVLNEIKEARNSPPSDRNHLCDKILSNPNLADETKDTALALLHPEKRVSLLKQNVPKLLRAQNEERLRICKIFKGEDSSLQSDSTTAIRKETYSAVMIDAFGPLGFEPYKKKNGLWSYIKPLTSEYSVFIEPDAASMEEDYTDWTPDPLRYWPHASFDRVTFLGSAKGSSNRRMIVFLPIFNCLAATKLQGYDDKSSLEVMVRAQALWHELNITPFERAVMQLN